MNKHNKLWEVTDERCTLALYAAHSHIPHSGIRVLFWPNLIPCWTANMYLVTLLRKGLSTGTVNTYITELSFFIRFIFNNKLKFDIINDETMHAFSNYLVKEPEHHFKQSLRRGGRQVNKILRRSLVFLKWYQTIFQPDQLIVGDLGSGARIIVENKVLYIKTKSIKYLWHSSMVPNDVPRDIKPLSRNIYLQLLEACNQITKSTYIQARTRTLLKILADTGARRVEILHIRISDIIDAVKTGQGKLVLFTAKRYDQKKRLVPIPKPTLDAILSFIEIKRKLHIQRLIKNKVILQDPDWLFVNDRGRQLNVETITQDIARLRKIAKIPEKATAHMLRHRWITIQVLERLKAYIGKKLPMDVATTILTKVASMTGHKNIGSLWIYIDLAFEEMGIWDTAGSVINMRLNAEAAHRELCEIRNMHKDGSNLTKEEIKHVDQLLYDLLNNINPKITVPNKEIGLKMEIDTHSFR